MAKSALIKCPVCGKANDYFSQPLGPFCCDRCKLVDLGKWLGEEYRVSEPLRPDHFAEFDPDQPINRARPDDEYTP